MVITKWLYFIFLQITYRRMKDALVQLSKGVQRGPASELIHVLFGEKPPVIVKKAMQFSLYNKNLDHSQVITFLSMFYACVHSQIITFLIDFYYNSRFLCSFCRKMLLQKPYNQKMSFYFMGLLALEKQLLLWKLSCKRSNVDQRYWHVLLQILQSIILLSDLSLSGMHTTDLD